MSERLRSEPVRDEKEIEEKVEEKFGVREQGKEIQKEAKEEKKTQPKTTKAELGSLAALLAEKAQSIPKEAKARLIVKLMQEFMSDELSRPSEGESYTGVADMITEAETTDPTLRFINEMYLRQLALAHGERLVDSKLIDQSVRTIREDSKKGWFSRVFRGQQTETVIIQEMERLQGMIEVKRLELAKIETELAEKEKRSLEIMRQAKEEAKETTQKAEEKAEKIIQKAETKAEKIVSDTKEEVESAEKKKSFLEKQIIDLEAARQSLLSSPETREAYESRVKDDERKISEMQKKLELFLLKAIRNYEIQGEVNNIVEKLHLFKLFLEIMDEYKFLSETNRLHVLKNTLDEIRKINQPSRSWMVELLNIFINKIIETPNLLDEVSAMIIQINELVESLKRDHSIEKHEDKIKALCEKLNFGADMLEQPGFRRLSSKH